MSGVPRPRWRTVTPDRGGPIGFYGCADRGGRLVRCEFVGKGKPPANLRVACPACGNSHRATPMWRAAVDLDKARDPDVVVGDSGDIGKDEEAPSNGPRPKNARADAPTNQEAA